MSISPIGNNPSFTTLSNFSRNKVSLVAFVILFGEALGYYDPNYYAVPRTAIRTFGIIFSLCWLISLATSRPPPPQHAVDEAADPVPLSENINTVHFETGIDWKIGGEVVRYWEPSISTQSEEWEIWQSRRSGFNQTEPSLSSSTSISWANPVGSKSWFLFDPRCKKREAFAFPIESSKPLIWDIRRPTHCFESDAVSFHPEFHISTASGFPYQKSPGQNRPFEWTNLEGEVVSFYHHDFRHLVPLKRDENVCNSPLT